MKGYMEEGAWLSCSFDLAGAPQQLQRHLSQEKMPVQYASGKRFLTEKDKNTLQCFKCKSPAKFVGGMLAFVGGIAVGAALVLSGPVGWIALGAIAAVAIGTTVAVFSHDCSDKQLAGSWELLHPTVLIKGSKPLLYNYSLLTCKAGGLLIASETEVLAEQTSAAMKYNTRQELGLQILSQAIFGIATGYTSGSAPVAAYNAVLGAGIYTIGEQENGTKPGLIASGTKLYGPDKWLGLYSSSVKNLTGRAFARDFFMGKSGFLAGTTVTIFTAVSDYFSNNLEESLQNLNTKQLRKIQAEDKNSAKKVFSINYIRR